MVTYSDSRNVWCVDIGRRVVYVATDSGVWRFSRYTGDPLDPWYTGIGIQEAIPLTGGQVILWHENSSTLWLATMHGLLYYRSDYQTWYRLENYRLNGKRITSLGETDRLVLVEIDDAHGGIYQVDPFSSMIDVMKNDPPGKVRWTGRRGWTVHEYPHYYPTDFDIFFDREDGRITDWEHHSFKPVYEAYNEYDQKRYLCYPGLGLVVADEHRRSLEVVQLGPAGSDVKCIAIDDDGTIWTGGDNRYVRSGFTHFDRERGHWKRFDSRLIPGLDSHHAWDVITHNKYVYFATDHGLVYCKPDRRDWHTIDRFDGLVGLFTRALSIGAGYLYVGGDDGLNRITLPSGPVWGTESVNANELITSDLTAEGDTVWAAGLQGVFRIKPKIKPERVIDGQIIGRESVRSIAIAESTVWVGTTRNITAFDKENLTQTDYLESVYLKGGKPLTMACNDSLLWVGTDRGLFRFNRLRGKWSEFNTQHGLPHTRIQRLVLEADTLWIGTVRGLTRFIWNRPERDGY